MQAVFRLYEISVSYTHLDVYKRQEEHKAKISKATKGRKAWNEGKKMTKEHVLKNMVAHIKYDVDLEFYQQFDDVEKIKCLNRMLTRGRAVSYTHLDVYKRQTQYWIPTSGRRRR